MPEAKWIKAGQASELQTALRDVSDEIGDLVLSELEDIAKAVASDARARVPHRSGRAQASYRSSGAAVLWGDGVPYVPWLEFGGKVGRKDSVSRPYTRKGRYVYPAIAERMAEIEERVDDLISQLTAGFLEVEG